MNRNVITILIIAIWGTIAFPGCKDDKQENKTSVTRKMPERGEAKGGRVYGGTFRLAENEYFNTLFPPMIFDAISYRTGTQVYEGLVKFSQDSLKIIPSIAESWTIDSAGKVYTFKIKKGVMFHDDECFENSEGRELTANDIKKCFQNIGASSKYKQAYEIVLKGNVVGAATDLNGIKVIDNHTLQISLENPNSGFLYTLARPFCFIYPEEALKKYGDKMHIGTGPFRVVELDGQKQIVMARNEYYHAKDKEGNQLPLLDSLIITFEKDKDKEVTAFKKGKLDMIYRLPTDFIIEIMESDFGDKVVDKKYIDQRSAEMSIQYYELLNTHPVFSKKDVRKALSYAIDRDMIVYKVLSGEAAGPGIHGLTPTVFKDISGYDITKIKGYNFDLQKAKSHLAKAGYPNGKGFPKLVLDVNKGGGLHPKVAEEIKAQLKTNLNIDMQLNIIELNDKIIRQRKGLAMMNRAGWIADYPSPDNFLNLLYGKNVPADPKMESYPNTSRYQNPKFDELYEKGLTAATQEEANKYYLQAEQIAMEDAPIIVLWYDENYRILQPHVQNFPNNPMQYRDFSEVWIDKSAKKGTKKPAAKPQS